MNLFVITPAAGKRLIGKALAVHPAVSKVLGKGTLVIVAGTTNACVAQEILRQVAQTEGFSARGFRRGVTIPPGTSLPAAKFPGDVVVVDGRWQKGKEIFDVVNDMKTGDLILKGANAVNLRQRRAAVLVGHPQAGTAGAAIPAVAGRRVKMIVPVGLEKRVEDDIGELAERVNSPDSHGPRLLPLPGEVFTELDAIRLLTGAGATLVAAGGIAGAEGACWIGVHGSPEQLDAASRLLKEVESESPCEA